MTDFYAIRDLAEELDISWQTLTAWKRQNRLPADAITADGMYVKSIIEPLVEEFKSNGVRPEPVDEKPKRKQKPRKPVAKKIQKTVTSPIDFDEFVRRYWKENNRAVDVLLMPPEEAAKILECTNEALKYAYETLEK